MYWYQGRLREMSETLDVEDIEVGEHHARRAWIACQRGELPTARRLLDEATAAGVTEHPDEWMWLVLMSIWGEVATHVGARERAETLYAVLRPYHDRLAVTGSHVYAAVAHPLGMLAAFLGADAAADDHFREAIAVAQRVGAVYLARAQAGWGAVLVRRDAPDDAARGEELLRSALETATRYGCDGVAREAQAVLTSLTR